MRKNIFVVSILFCLFSCKEEPKVVQQEKKETFRVALDLIVKADDSLQLFYCEEGEQDYDGVKTVWAPIKGKETSQEVKFELPEDAMPTKIRIDFGVNKQQQPIEVKKFTMNYYDKSFQIKDTMFYQYFIPSHQIEWDRKKAVATLKPTNGETYDPAFRSRTSLEVELAEMFKN